MDSKANKRKIVDVVGAVIVENDKILCAQRGYGKQKGKWEFPGGKVDAGETPEEALKRELEEEIGIHILNAELYERFQFEYPTKILDFSFYLVTEWIGEPFGREGQEGFWLEQGELDAGQFPPANLKLIQRLVAESVK